MNLDLTPLVRSRWAFVPGQVTAVAGIHGGCFLAQMIDEYGSRPVNRPIALFNLCRMELADSFPDHVDVVQCDDWPVTGILTCLDHRKPRYQGAFFLLGYGSEGAWADQDKVAELIPRLVSLAPQLDVPLVYQAALPGDRFLSAPAEEITTEARVHYLISVLPPGVAQLVMTAFDTDEEAVRCTILSFRGD